MPEDITDLGRSTKFCCSCGGHKPLSEFYIREGGKLRNYCKKCVRAASVKTYRRDPEKSIRRSSQWAKDHPEETKATKRKSRKNASPESRAATRAYSRAYQQQRRDEDINFNLAHVLRVRIRSAIGSHKKAAKSEVLLGCSVQHLRAWLEFWMQPGMTWENYGKHGWHIDHKRPCASFDLTKPEQQRECFNYRNLQPLWAQENHSKGAKYNG